MQFDNKVNNDEGPARDHRVRADHVRDRTDQGAAGAQSERPLAGGPEPVSRPEHGAPQDDSEQGRERERELAAEERAARDRAAQNRAAAMRVLTQHLRLPTDVELDVEVDVQSQQVRFLVRDRETGEVVRTVPPEDTASLADKLREFTGVLVDRSL